MKKLFWGAMYVLAAALLALTVYLYVLPEGEIALGDRKTEESTAALQPVPEISVGGITVEVGVTKLSALLDQGFTLKYEDEEGYFTDLDHSTAEADPATQYSVVLMKNGDYVATMKYSNASSAVVPIGDCTVDAMEFNTEAQGYGKIEVLLAGVDMTQGRSMSEIPQQFKDFTRAVGAVEEYSKTTLTENQFVVAYVRASELSESKVGEFGVINYQPGGEGTGGGQSAASETAESGETVSAEAESAKAESASAEVQESETAAAEESNGNH